MAVTDAQVRKMMEEYTKANNLSRAALKAGMDRKTARKYRDTGELPSQRSKVRTYRTRQDPFAEDWAEVEQMLRRAPELQARTLFEYLCRQYPGKYQEGQLRTLQRRVRRWRAQSGPPKEVFFPQQHRPGQAAQTDFTWMNGLGITIQGERFDHLLCHVVLPYSNWEWATVCRSESMAALREGVQAALFRLGRVPEYHQTDNSTAATHRVGDKREFNDDYLALMRHLGLKPRTIAVGRKEQNGDVESSHNVLKNRVEQHLLLRGSRDFESVARYAAWLEGVLEQANQQRSERLSEELAVMRKLDVRRLPAWSPAEAKVTSWSTIRVKKNTYSVPSRLIGERVDVRVFDDRLEVLHAGTLQATMERLHGENRHRINYRHIIWSLVRKPGAFARYRYREDLFPSVVFRQAYDRLCEEMAERKADLAYLRTLHLAATSMEADVEAALQVLLEAGQVPVYEEVKALVTPPEAPVVPQLSVYTPDLGRYDGLLSCGGAL